MALAASYNTTGNREDLTDILSVLEPEATPLLSLAKKKKATATFNEWQCDSLTDPNIAGVNEGEDVTSFQNATVNRARLGNYVQKFRDSYMVSDIEQLTSVAGVSSEFAEAEGKSTRQVKRSIETAICSTQDRQADAGAGAPYLTRGLTKWLEASLSDVPDAYECVARDTTTPITEVLFNGVLQDLYNANGMPGGQLTLIAGATLKKDISFFSRTSSTTSNTYQVTQTADAKKITLSVNIYEGDFGNVAIVPSTFVSRTAGAPGTVVADAGLLVDPEYVGVFTLKAESRTELEDQGGGKRGYVDVVCGLACYSPKAHGVFS